MAKNVVELPEDFIGLPDRRRLESFGAYLIANGRAVNWYWNRERGVDVAFEIVHRVHGDERLLSIRRNQKKDTFYVVSAAGKKIDEGALTYLMTVVNDIAESATS